MTAQRKRWLLGLGLAATLLLTWLAPDNEAQVKREASGRALRGQSAPVALNTVATPAPAAMRQEQLTRPERQPAADVPDLFKGTSWYVPPPPPPPAPPPPPPPPPSAPSLPFAFLGQVVEDQRVQVVLARGDRVVTVAVGDSIDKNYRLESFQGGTLTFLYIPLDTRQTLVTGVSQ
jgi:hypothetical protein